MHADVDVDVLGLMDVIPLMLQAKPPVENGSVSRPRRASSFALLVAAYAYLSCFLERSPKPLPRGIASSCTGNSSPNMHISICKNSSLKMSFTEKHHKLTSTDDI